MCNGRSSSLVCLSLLACSLLFGSRAFFFLFSSRDDYLLLLPRLFSLAVSSTCYLSEHLHRGGKRVYKLHGRDRSLSLPSRLSTVVEITPRVVSRRENTTLEFYSADYYKNRACVCQYGVLRVCVCVRACLSSPSRVFPLNKINIQLVNCYYKETFSVCVVL